ncbi:pectin methylesterase-like acyl-CoA thioesterase [Allocatelliglobosispora scoriae]|uniref:Pectinesterase n=1 Tax=Allocatelliglobosispora scoriae TaxID=643052 RepID=A0A841BSE4_9ACTN|nr:pectinesterase family protein [Allocatelliglobosispora scoriae]MBB5869833.1 pectin methylesterase-like acyl-CoA thioesterase [Allocatelliglobosispora scoriae]
MDTVPAPRPGAPTPGRHRPAIAALLATVLTVVLIAAIGLLTGRSAYAATLFGDDFTDGDTAGWSKSGGAWSVVADGSNALTQSKVDTDSARLFAGTASWTAYTVQARVKPLSFGSGGFVAVLARAAGSTTFYRVALRSGNLVELQAVRSGTVTVLGSLSRSITLGEWYQVGVEVSGTTVRGYLNGTLFATGTSTAAASGRIGVQTGYATARFDDVIVTTGVTPSPSAPASGSASPSPPASPSASASIPPSPSPSVPPASSAVVAKDGSGTHTTVQAAVDSAPANRTTPWVIAIKPGTYHEPVTIPSDRTYLTFLGLGAGPADVVISYDRANGTTKPEGGTYGTSGSASVTIDGDGFTARNLTFANTFDEAGHPEIANKQAVAVLTRADRLVFDNVRFLGNQDTLYHNSSSVDVVGRAYFRQCYVEGDVDFIFGRGTGVFDRCEIKSLDRGSSSNNGYVTAASTSIANPYGYLFTHCTLTSPAAAKSVYLGRPWHPGGDVNAIAQVVFRDSTLGAHILDAPWTDMSGFSWRDARFFEHANTGPGSVIGVDRPQLSSAQAAALTPQAYLAGNDGWNPIY